MSTHQVPQILTRQEFMDAVKISTRTLARLQHLLPDRRTLAGRRFYLPEDVNTYLQLKETSNALPDNQPSDSLSPEIGDSSEL